MRILVLGSGGREHALVKKIASSDLSKEIYICPGNGGTARVEKTQNIHLQITSPYGEGEILRFARDKKIDLVVVGTEEPLVGGISDILTEAGIKVFGPSKKAAWLEGSKHYAKEIMEKAQVKTAPYRVFTAIEQAQAKDYICENEKARVLKADGLCAGKGVIVAATQVEALDALSIYFETNRFGKAADKILIEDLVTGEEASVIAFTDGHSLKVLPPSQDHKRLLENDQGPNTGGMGVYAPVNFLTDKHLDFIQEDILKPIIDTLRAEGIVYKGMLYAGLMVGLNDINVLEFNVRFGDPECQCVLPLLENDVLEIMMACVEERLDEIDLKVKDQCACTVVMASRGYPNSYEIGKIISGVESIREVTGQLEIFEAGTKQQGNHLVTNGGRVLALTSLDNHLAAARELVYENIKKISFAGSYYRKDIGNKAL